MTSHSSAVTAAGPLSWLRAVDLTDMRGALCGRILADLGADVVKVLGQEPAGGDNRRLAYRYRNANKRGVELDLSSPAGRDRLDALLADADVLIENLDAPVRSALDLDPAAVGTRHDHLVHVALADFGLTGPGHTGGSSPSPRWRRPAPCTPLASPTSRRAASQDISPMTAPRCTARSAPWRP